MSEILMVVGLVALAGLAVAALIERRREAGYREFMRRHREQKADVEREARSRL